MWTMGFAGNRVFSTVSYPLLIRRRVYHLVTGVCGRLKGVHRVPGGICGSPIAEAMFGPCLASLDELPKVLRHRFIQVEPTSRGFGSPFNFFFLPASGFFTHSPTLLLRRTLDPVYMVLLSRSGLG